MEELIKILSVLGFSATKYLFGVGLTFTYDFSLFGSIFLTVGGGMLGVLIFGNFSGWLLNIFGRTRPEREEQKTKVTRTRRWLVKVRARYGLAGIAFLTPIFLTVPVGTFIAASVTKNKAEIALYMFVSFMFWSTVFCTAYYFLGLNIQDVFKKALPWL